MLLPAFASAQWVQDTTFVPDSSDLFFEVHGVAVDAEDKVWVQSYYNTETIIVNRDLGSDGVPDTLSTRAIYIYNADGTPADFSPLKVIEYSDDTPADTLGLVWMEDHYEGFSGRGIEADMNGDIIISAWNRLYKIDHTTGMGIAKVDPGIGSLTEASVDAENNVYVSAVVGTEAPIIMYDENFGNADTLLRMTSGFSRDLQVSPDGMTIWWAGYSTGVGVLQYTKPDEFSSFNAVPDTVLRGTKVESFDIHPITKYLWIGSGSLNDVPSDEWTPQTWYAFDYATLGTDETRLDSIRWVPGGEEAFDSARPRGLDFSSDGTTAYLGGFSALETDVDLQKFTTDQTFSSIEEPVTDLPQGYKLEQNYPNPFNPTTTINYSVGQAGPVTLKVFDITGREVATLVNTRMSAGSHTVTFDASNLASGVYIYSLNANGTRLTNRMTLIK